MDENRSYMTSDTAADAAQRIADDVASSMRDAEIAIAAARLALGRAIRAMSCVAYQQGHQPRLGYGPDHRPISMCGVTGAGAAISDGTRALLELAEARVADLYDALPSSTVERDLAVRLAIVATEHAAADLQQYADGRADA